jgi:hypothetical protein
MRTPITLTYISGLAKDFEHTDLKHVKITDVPVYFCYPDSRTLGVIEDDLGRTPDGSPFATRKEAEEWLKVWVGKEITKLHDKVREYSEGLHTALGKDVESIDDGVHG